MKMLKEYQKTSEEVMLDEQIDEALKKAQAQGKRLSEQVRVLEQRYNEDR